jgi:hypothetical protein
MRWPYGEVTFAEGLSTTPETQDVIEKTEEQDIDEAAYAVLAVRSPS